jgi:adenine deaminase
VQSVPTPKKKSINIGMIDLQSFEIKTGPGIARVIGVTPDQIVTKSLLLQPKIVNSRIVSDTSQDILKMAVVERHNGTGNVGLGLVKGFSLVSGALATSVTHDSHNIAVVGVGDEEMLAAVLAVERMGGGLAVVANNRVLAELPLYVAGLLSEMHMQDVANGINNCIERAHEIGCDLIDPFMTLSFLCLPVIPELKLTDLGLVDVTQFQFVPLILEKS